MYVQNCEYLQAGDTLRVPGTLGLYHYGTYVGNGFVAELNKMTGGKLVPLPEFADGQLVEIVSRAPSWGEQQKRVDRALSLRGAQYDLLTSNCEHGASYAATGEAESPTVRGLVTVGLMLFGLWWFGSDN